MIENDVYDCVMHQEWEKILMIHNELHQIGYYSGSQKISVTFFKRLGELTLPEAMRVGGMCSKD